MTKEKVASRAEAWIETLRSFLPIHFQNVASRAEAWIETVIVLSQLNRELGRLPRGGVD